MTPMLIQVVVAVSAWWDSNRAGKTRDLAASTKRAKDLGATMIMDNIPVADYGRFTIFKDLTGAVIARWQGSDKT